MTLPVQVLVLAKEPVPGRVKTRLCPPLSPQQAAGLAAASLADTLDAVRATDVARRVLVVDGDYAAAGFDVLRQRGDRLDERLAAAFDDAFSDAPLPLLLVGMDTPQLDPLLLDTAAGLLLGADAVLGLAHDGGWWCLGLRRPDAALLLGVVPSRSDTGHFQQQRLVGNGLALRELPVLRDVDTLADALAVRPLCPHGRFAAALDDVVTAVVAG